MPDIIGTKPRIKSAGLEFGSVNIKIKENRIDYLKLYIIICQVYLRREQERGLMQKTRRLMDNNSVSFQMFLIQLSFIAIGSESQIFVDQVTL